VILCSTRFSPNRRHSIAIGAEFNWNLTLIPPHSSLRFQIAANLIAACACYRWAVACFGALFRVVGAGLASNLKNRRRAKTLDLTLFVEHGTHGNDTPQAPASAQVMKSIYFSHAI
jgi:hypothetical protein